MNHDVKAIYKISEMNTFLEEGFQIPPLELGTFVASSFGLRHQTSVPNVHRPFLRPCYMRHDFLSIYAVNMFVGPDTVTNGNDVGRWNISGRFQFWSESVPLQFDSRKVDHLHDRRTQSFPSIFFRTQVIVDLANPFSPSEVTSGLGRLYFSRSEH